MYAKHTNTDTHMYTMMCVCAFVLFARMNFCVCAFVRSVCEHVGMLV